MGRNLHDLSDELLFEEVRSGSKEAFEELFNRFWYPLYKNCFSAMRSHEEAEEIVQDLLVTLWNKKETLLIGNVAAYLNTAVRRRIIDRVRSKMSQTKYWEYYKNHIPTFGEVTAEAIDFTELQKEIDLVLATLPEKSQQVFRLNRLEGYSIDEIAEELQMPRRTIEYHLTKSVNALRLHLKNSIFTILLLLAFC